MCTGTFGTVTHLHTDEADNVLCQVGGHKLVRLWPPEVGDACFHVDETRGGNGASNKFSPIDAEAPDLEKFPKFADAAGEVFRLRVVAGRFAVHTEGMVAPRAVLDPFVLAQLLVLRGV